MSLTESVLLTGRYLRASYAEMSAEVALSEHRSRLRSGGPWPN